MDKEAISTFILASGGRMVSGKLAAETATGKENAILPPSQGGIKGE